MKTSSLLAALFAALAAASPLRTRSPFTCPTKDLQELCEAKNTNSYCTPSGQFVTDMQVTCKQCVCTASCLMCADTNVAGMVEDEAPAE